MVKHETRKFLFVSSINECYLYAFFCCCCCRVNCKYYVCTLGFLFYFLTLFFVVIILVTVLNKYNFYWNLFARLFSFLLKKITDFICHYFFQRSFDDKLFIRFLCCFVLILCLYLKCFPFVLYRFLNILSNFLAVLTTGKNCNFFDYGAGEKIVCSIKMNFYC